MSVSAALDLELGFEDYSVFPGGKSRKALLRGLTDVVATPSSSIPAPDRSMAADILLDMLLTLTDQERATVANRLTRSSEAPRRLLRYLAMCSINVCEPLLLENEGFDASDLARIAKMATQAHRELIARRKHVPVSVSDVLVEAGESAVVELLLKNSRAELSEYAVDLIVKASRVHTQYCALMERRDELTAAQALAMFWWADADLRQQFLRRYAADRDVLIDRCAAIFPMLVEEKFADTVVTAAMSLIERRQRNREALKRSRFESLEHAVEEAAIEGMSAEMAQEIGYLAGVKPVTIGKILTDPGGEGIAVLCKATGLKRPYLERFWFAMRRTVQTPDGSKHPGYERVTNSYEVISVGRAQTILRYWNWSLATALSTATAQTDVSENRSEGYGTSLDLAKLAIGES